MIHFDPETQEEYARREARALAWARFLGRRWDAAVTFTHRDPDPPPALLWALVARWAEALEARRGKLPYVAVLERCPMAHVHALVGGIGVRFAPVVLQTSWRHGDADVIPQPGRRHVLYVARKMDEGEILVPDNLRTRLRRVRRQRRT